MTTLLVRARGRRPHKGRQDYVAASMALLGGTSVTHLTPYRACDEDPCRILNDGGRGRLRQHYHAGQENQLGALGLMVNLIVLWQTVYLQAALDHLVANGHEPDPADVARLSPLGHPVINLQVRYRTTSRAPGGGLRPLRTAG